MIVGSNCFAYFGRCGLRPPLSSGVRVAPCFAPAAARLPSGQLTQPNLTTLPMTNASSTSSSMCLTRAIRQYKPCQDTVEASIAGLSFESYRSIDDIAYQWDTLSQVGHIFSSTAYLKTVEAAPPQGLDWRYMLIKENDELIGALYFQIMPFNAEQSLDTENPSKESWTKRQLKKLVRFNALVCGNLLLSGAHGFVFKPSVDSNKRFEYMHHGMKLMRQTLQKEGINCAVSFVKDFCGDEHLQCTVNLKPVGFHPFSAQPCMRMDLPEAWNSYEDYLMALGSKYRMRARRAVKKSAEFNYKELDLDGVKLYKDIMYKLYRNVREKIDFSSFDLNPDYFVALKTQFGNDYRVFLVEDKGQAIAFYTVVNNGPELDAHFLGIDYSYNTSHQLYLRILLEMVKMGIEGAYKYINFSRTAMEIKSSVGATPVDLYFYLKHHNPLINSFMPAVFKRLTPVDNWTPRHPFKED
jgi:hypothetical protein